jgi:hypothetical protein
MRPQAELGLIAASALAGVAAADSAPVGPGDPTWAIRSVLGFTKTGGNTDNRAGNVLFHVAHVMGDWKLLFGVDGLYGSTKGRLPRRREMRICSSTTTLRRGCTGT